MGFPVREMRTAAHTRIEKSLHPDVVLNDAALSALTQYYFYRENMRQHDTFVFSPALESVGKWYRQLLGESIGKPVVGDESKRIGITPTVTVGSTDLHSVGQLYLGGPRDRLTTFVSIQSRPDVEVPSERAWPDIVPMITGKSANSILGAIEAGTKAAYDQNNLPYLEARLDTLAPESIADFMQF
jgi:glucose-6-phosphate isomerase